MKRFLFISMFVSLLGFGLTGCEKVEEFMNYSKVTIAYSYPNESPLFVAEYSDLKIIFDDKEYNSIGTYTVPVGTTIKLSWKWDGLLYGCNVNKQQGNAEVRVDSYKKIKVTLAGPKILIE
jgi:hypothetical protein